MVDSTISFLLIIGAMLPAFGDFSRVPCGTGCNTPNSMLAGRRSKVEVHPQFDTAFYKIFNAFVDMCERTSCDKVPINSCDLT